MGGYSDTLLPAGYNYTMAINCTLSKGLVTSYASIIIVKELTNFLLKDYDILIFNRLVLTKFNALL